MNLCASSQCAPWIFSVFEMVETEHKPGVVTVRALSDKYVDARNTQVTLPLEFFGAVAQMKV